MLYLKPLATCRLLTAVKRPDRSKQYHCLQLEKLPLNDMMSLRCNKPPNETYPGAVINRAKFHFCTPTALGKLKRMYRQNFALHVRLATSAGVSRGAHPLVTSRLKITIWCAPAYIMNSCETVIKIVF